MRTAPLVIACLAISACGNDTPAMQPSPDLSSPPVAADMAMPAPSPQPACPAGTRDCVDIRVARVCPADAAGWLTVQCPTGTACLSGDCVAPPPLCTSADDGCDANTALHCMVDATGVGTAFSMMPCPMGTTCVGAGLCKGTCVVGSSICVDLHTLATCNADGTGYATTACDPIAGELCVRVADGDNPQAACKASSCTPDPSGCNQRCAGASAFTICTETPAGYQPLPVQCAPGKTCNPTAAACGVARQADCTSVCTDGQQRCTADGSGHQSCNAGQWDPPVACATPTQPRQQCLADPNNPAHTLCGHPICAAGLPGSCDAQGSFRACGPDGQLGPATPCAAGRCAPLTPPALNPPSAFQGPDLPGVCLVDCQDGDTQCVAEGGSSLRSCDKGLWTAATMCAGGALCFTGATAAGRPSAICGAACTPGRHRCVNAGGGSDGGVNDGGVSSIDDIETCSPAGQWGAAAPCASGLGCLPAGDTRADAVCAAECVPNTTVCVGSAANATGVTIAGTQQTTRCAADGRLIDTILCSGPSGPFPCCNDGNSATTCAACSNSQVCRRHHDGSALGCVDCVGANNEDGLEDTRCNPGPQMCLADNTWGPAVACGNGLSCTPPLTTRATYCHPFGGLPVTSNTAIINISGGDFDCEHVPVGDGSFGPPVPCGATPDCCAEFCSADVPTPATCVATPAG